MLLKVYLCNSKLIFLNSNIMYWYYSFRKVAENIIRTQGQGVARGEMERGQSAPYPDPPRKKGKNREKKGNNRESNVNIGKAKQIKVIMHLNITTSSINPSHTYTIKTIFENIAWFLVIKEHTLLSSPCKVFLSLSELRAYLICLRTSPWFRSSTAVILLIIYKSMICKIIVSPDSC